MFKLLRQKRISTAAPAGGYDAPTCKRLLTEQLDYIAKVCEKAAGQAEAAYSHCIAGEGGHGYLVERAGRLDKDELFVQVLDHLQEDDYRRLREFKGTSSITTYLTAIISRLVVDIVRSRTGRNRAKERAERFGELGRRTYELVVQARHTISETVEILQINYGMIADAGQLQAILGEMQGRNSRYPSDTDHETAWNDSGELVSIQRDTPEQKLADKQQDKKRKEVLKQVLDSMTAEDKLLVRLRFPLDDATDPLDAITVAKMLGLNQQEVERRTRRVLTTCRELLLKQGVSLDALL
ncbi:sigma-70 family RNA polymerase sigma factor [Trichlorobacter lovleyi]|uniref:sigma-70 family RNA polymerase sigma factor n=1 Tax=Trichlorobacter lovleyi TaxID=313985 RepID=UPI003D13EA5A